MRTPLHGLLTLLVSRSCAVRTTAARADAALPVEWNDGWSLLKCCDMLDMMLVLRVEGNKFNTFTAPACKISRLKKCICMPANSVFSDPLTIILSLSILCILKPFDMLMWKRKQKWLRILNFTLLFVVFKRNHGSERVKSYISRCILIWSKCRRKSTILRSGTVWWKTLNTVNPGKKKQQKKVLLPPYTDKEPTLSPHPTPSVSS